MTHIVVSALTVLAAAFVPAENGPRMALPRAEEVLVIASDPRGLRPHFTPASLLEALPRLKPGDAEIKVGARRVWQSGVIVLKNKDVLFWTTCRNNFIHVSTRDGVASFIIGDGKDDL